MTVTIIGLGLIGGSIALDLKARRFSDRIIGVDRKEEHQEIALERGLVDEVMSLHAGISQADIVVLAIPVDGIKKLLPTVLDYCTHQVVTDMGSSKLEIINAVKSSTKITPALIATAFSTLLDMARAEHMPSVAEVMG